AGAGVPGRRRASITARASGIVGAMREQLPHRRRALVVTAVCLAGAIALGAAISSWSITLVLVVLLPLAMLGWQVRVDSAGLRVASGLWIFRQQVPAIEVLRADVVQVNPLAEFGG